MSIEGPAVIKVIEAVAVVMISVSTGMLRVNPPPKNIHFTSVFGETY